MKAPQKVGKLVWVARALAVAYVMFLSLFALDVFSGDASLFDKIRGFLIHLVPSLFILVPILLFWRSPRLCGLVYIALSIMFTVWNREYALLLAFPLFVIGVLFLIATFVPGRKTV